MKLSSQAGVASAVIFLCIIPCRHSSGSTITGDKHSLGNDYQDVYQKMEKNRQDAGKAFITGDNAISSHQTKVHTPPNSSLKSDMPRINPRRIEDNIDTNKLYAVAACGLSSATGRDDSDCKTQEVIIGTTTTNAVRCCSDSPKFHWPWRKNENCDVWAASRIGGCYRDKTWTEARDMCAGVGGRLCTTAEVVADCTANTGCGLNGSMIWTSSATFSSCQNEWNYCNLVCKGIPDCESLCAEHYQDCEPYEH